MLPVSQDSRKSKWSVARALVQVVLPLVCLQPVVIQIMSFTALFMVSMAHGGKMSTIQPSSLQAKV